MFHIPDQFDYIRFLNLSGEKNMAIDEVLFNSVKLGKRKGLFRIYAWSQPCITIGYFQKSQTLNLQKCRDHNISIVRRITGGRAVFHHHEITYSLILKGEETFLKEKIKLFSQLSEIILEGLSAMGLKGMISSKTLGETKNPNCFQTTSLCEIVSPQGKKLVGSALLIQNETILKQGSLPLSDSYKNLSYFLNNSHSEELNNINNLYLPPKENNKLRDQFISGIQRKISLSPSFLTSDEEDKIEILIKEKYQQDSWNLKR